MDEVPNKAVLSGVKPFVNCNFNSVQLIYYTIILGSRSSKPRPCQGHAKLLSLKRDVFNSNFNP